MSQPELAGYSLKDWSLIILLFILGIAVAVFIAGLVLAILNNPQITITGEIDLGQFTAIIVGIAMVAVTLVGQQLISKVQASAIKQTDDTWLESEKTEPK